MLRNYLLYFLELCLLFPFLPLLYFEGKKIRKKIIRLTPVSEYLYLPGHKGENSILVIGESTAAGVGASHASYSIGAQLQQLKEKHPEILNLGKNGLKAIQLKSLLLHGLDQENKIFEVTVILIGANDCFKFTPPYKFHQELEAFTGLLESQLGTNRIIFTAIPPIHQFPAIPRLLRFFLGWHRNLLVAALKSLSKSNQKIKLLDFNEKFESDLYARDGIHPSDLGYRKLAKMIGEMIE